MLKFIRPLIIKKNDRVIDAGRVKRSGHGLFVTRMTEQLSTDSV